MSIWKGERQVHVSHWDFYEKISGVDGLYLSAYKKFVLCDDCKHFPPENSSLWNQSLPCCKVGKEMMFLEPESPLDDLFGFIPATYTCDKFNCAGGKTTRVGLEKELVK